MNNNTMSISNEPSVRGYGAIIESLPEGSRLIMVIGDHEEMPWIRAGSGPEIKVFNESRFAIEWPEHAADNAPAHVWISKHVNARLPEIKAASVTRES